MSADYPASLSLDRALAVIGATNPTNSKSRPLADPAATDRIGKEISERTKGNGVDVVLAWNQTEDLILAYVVALAANARVAVARQEEGIVDLQGEIPAGASVLLLADAFREPNDLRALVGLVTDHQARVSVVATLVDTSVLHREIPAGAAVVCLGTATSGSSE